MSSCGAATTNTRSTVPPCMPWPVSAYACSRCSATYSGANRLKPPRSVSIMIPASSAARTVPRVPLSTSARRSFRLQTTLSPTAIWTGPYVRLVPRPPCCRTSSRARSFSQSAPPAKIVDGKWTERPVEREPTEMTKALQIRPKPSVGLEPTTPSLPWKGTGFTGVHGRSQMGTKSLQTAAIRSVRLWRPKYGRSGSSGRIVDALHSPVRLPNLQG